jgi:hypothetical protein
MGKLIHQQAASAPIEPSTISQIMHAMPRNSNAALPNAPIAVSQPAGGISGNHRKKHQLAGWGRENVLLLNCKYQFHLDHVRCRIFPLRETMLLFRNIKRRFQREMRI